MDGRAQEPAAKWLKQRFGLDFIDTITEPGADKFVAQANPAALDYLKKKVIISYEKHGSRIIAVAGHYDCAGNPVLYKEHLQHIRQAVAIIKSWNLPETQIIGLWINENWQVEETCSRRL